jgi:hypothetical protein
VNERPSVEQLLRIEGALLHRGDLRALGWTRSGVDAIFRQLPTVHVPGFSRPMIRAADYLRLLEQSTYDDDRVRHT